MIERALAVVELTLRVLLFLKKSVMSDPISFGDDGLPIVESKRGFDNEV